METALIIVRRIPMPACALPAASTAQALERFKPCRTGDSDTAKRDLNAPEATG